MAAGSNNIEIGTQGASADSGVIRIGALGQQTATYISGIAGVGVSGLAVIVSSAGQLGVVSSSRRYKQDIQSMGDTSDRLFKLRPVSFRFKQPDANGNKPIQYGLIAEEVAEVFPELVVYNKDGQPETVAYHLLSGLLLNELQKEHKQVQEQTEQLAAQNKLLAEQTKQIAEQNKQIAELKTQAADVAALKQQVSELNQLRAQIDELRRLTAQLASQSGKPAAGATALATRAADGASAGSR